MPRPTGSGKPKGYKAPDTLSKELGRERVRQIVLQHVDPLTKAQIANALGISHFMLRDPKTGKFERITEQVQIEAALNAEDAEEGWSYYIWTKDPSTAAFTDLMNRALDKPKEQEQDINLRGQLDIVGILRDRRNRRNANENEVSPRAGH